MAKWIVAVERTDRNEAMFAFEAEAETGDEAITQIRQLLVMARFTAFPERGAGDEQTISLQAR